MSKEIILTPFAESNYDDIITYLINKWGLKVANNFALRFREIIEIISKTPEIYPTINKVKRVQKCVVTKHNIVYFIQKQNAITIISVFDTRQSPEKLSNIIK